MSRILTPQQTQALFAVAHGADIYDRATALVLREVQKHAPELIDIGKAQMYKGDGTDQMPYFGAIATAKGIKFLKAHLSFKGGL